MKLIIQKPKNGYQGWYGYVVEANGARHKIMKWSGREYGSYVHFESREALVKAAKAKARQLGAGR